MVNVMVDREKVEGALSDLSFLRKESRVLSEAKEKAISNALHLKLASLAELLRTVGSEADVDYDVIENTTVANELVNEWEGDGTSVKQVEYFRKGDAHPFFGFVDVGGVKIKTPFCILTIAQESRYSIVVIDDSGEMISVGHDFVLPWNE